MLAVQNTQASQTQYIRLRGGRTLHHAVRVAQSLKLQPNLFVTIKFWETSLTIYEMSAAFSRIRHKFGKWIQRPARRFAGSAAPPTFLWVLENPDDRGFFHAHWFVFVPLSRQDDFQAKLNKWLDAVIEKRFTPEPIHIKAVPEKDLYGTVMYMLKGQFPSIARDHDIRPEYQGWIPGRKRSGCSENLGPTRHERLWRAGKHKRPEPWRKNKYQSSAQVI